MKRRDFLGILGAAGVAVPLFKGTPIYALDKLDPPEEIREKIPEVDIKNVNDTGCGLYIGEEKIGDVISLSNVMERNIVELRDRYGIKSQYPGMTSNKIMLELINVRGDLLQDSLMDMNIVTINMTEDKQMIQAEGLISDYTLNFPDNEVLMAKVEISINGTITVYDNNS